MTKKLNFWEWLKLANYQQYKFHYKYEGHKVPQCFIRGYIEYLHNFKCGITKVMKIKNTSGPKFTNSHKRKGNTTSRKHIPFLSFE